MRIFDIQKKAAFHHQAGLVRLFQLALRKECAYVLKNMPQSASIELAYNRLPKHAIVENTVHGTYKEDMLYLILTSVFVEGRTLRSQEAFEQSLQQNKAQLVNTANEAGKTALDIMGLYSTIKTLLNRFPIKDLNEQLELLVYAGFIRNTPYQYFKSIPRYLKAIQYRLDKLSHDPQKIQEISRYSIRFWKEIEKEAKKNSVIPEQDPFRWALEEFRVSLFAQQLKTAYPISAKRMDKVWDERNS